MTSALVKLSRQRFKAMRLDQPVPAAADHADRLVALLEPAAQSDPAPVSPAYAQWVADSFSNRFLTLCAAHPVRARRP
jgi:hypothetical protein